MTIFVVTFNMFCDMVEYDNNEQVTHIRLSAGAAYLCDWHFALLAYAALPFVGRAQRYQDGLGHTCLIRLCCA